MREDQINQRLDNIEKLLKEQLLLTKTVLSFDETLLYLGCSKWHLYHLTSHRLIPFFKEGKKLRFNRFALEAYMQGNPMPTMEELNKKAEDHTIISPRTHKLF